VLALRAAGAADMLGWMKQSAFGLVIVGWICAAGAAFLALFDCCTTDDYAGWIPVVVAMQVPAFFALRGKTVAKREALLAGARRWVVVPPAAIVAAMGVFWTTGSIGSLIWEPKFLELRPLLLATVAGFVAIIVAAVAFARVLGSAPYPRGLRTVLLVVTALGVAGVGAMAMPFLGRARIHEAGEWLLVGIPLLWVIPLWLLVALESKPEPPIPRVIVAR
jgi:hypothetical protein